MNDTPNFDSILRDAEENEVITVRSYTHFRSHLRAKTIDLRVLTDDAKLTTKFGHKANRSCRIVLSDIPGNRIQIRLYPWKNLYAHFLASVPA